MIAAQCYITDCNHGMKLDQGPMRTQPMKIKSCRIGENCWIGTGVKVLAGSNIKEGSVLGAGCIIDGECDSDKIYIPYRETKSINRK